MSAVQRWETALQGWGLPQALVDAAPDDPWRFEAGELRATTDSGRRGERPSPADVAAQDALPRRGSVLDVGCGPGGASASLRGIAGRLTGVDHRPEALSTFAAAPAARGLRRLVGSTSELATVEGRWPDVAADVEPHDVVVCHNVLYDVGTGVEAFVAALHARARVRVVLVVTARHPLAWLSPYLEQLHGLTRPLEPTADTAADLVHEVTGVRPTVVPWTVHLDPPTDELAFERLVARRCCVGEERIDDVRLALHRTPPPEARGVVALVWDGGASTA